MTRRVAIVLLLVAAPLVAFVAVMGSRVGQGDGARPIVVATIYPLAEFAREIGGKRVEVRTLVPAGVEPHDYEPSPQDVARIMRARLFIYDGAGLEPWTERLLPALPSGVGVVRATQGLTLLKAAGGTGPAGLDPHAWLDPVRAQQMIATIEDALVNADPAGAETYRRRAAALRGHLADLHVRFTDGLARCERRLVVATHTAFTYLAARYRLELVGLAGLAPEAELSPGSLAALARTLRARDVRTIFVEPLGSRRAAEALAREVGARTLVLDPIEGVVGVADPDIQAGAGYLRLMQDNLTALRAGLGCR